MRDPSRIPVGMGKALVRPPLPGYRRTPTAARTPAGSRAARDRSTSGSRRRRAEEAEGTGQRRLGDRPETLSRVGIGSERVPFGGSCERRAVGPVHSGGTLAVRPRPETESRVGLLVQLLADCRQRRARVRIPRLDRERALELARRLREQPLRPVDLPQVAVRVVAWLVAWRLDRRLEPGNRLVETPELDQVRADVVVRIPEVGVDRDRLLALRDRVLEPPLEAVGPAEEGVRLGGGVERDRLPVALDGGLQLAR